MESLTLSKKSGLTYTILLQLKFIIVEWLNLTYTIIPHPLRRFYLRIFGIKIGQNSCIHRGCKFFHIGKLCIGKNSVVNFGCYLDNRRGISIGNNVGIAHNTKIYTAGHNINSPLFEPNGNPVVVEDNVFIFSNVLIMPGVTIGKGAIILPGSVVTKNIPPRKIAGGNPAKIVKERTAEINYKQKYNYWFAL